MDVGRHDVRLVLAGDLARYTYRYASPGADLPRPKTVLRELSDPLRGPKLDAAWLADLHEGNASTGFADGRFFIQYAHYGYAHIRRKLGQGNVSVQCTIMDRPTGGEDSFCAGLGLWWANGAYVRAIPGYGRRKFQYEVNGQPLKRGRDINTDTAPRWYPYSANAVKIQLVPDAIRFYVSTDGKTWQLDHQVKRAKALAGAPEWVILGNGASRGKQSLFRNVLGAHFTPERATRVTAFSDFVVGRE